MQINAAMAEIGVASNNRKLADRFVRLFRWISGCSRASPTSTRPLRQTKIQTGADKTNSVMTAAGFPFEPLGMSWEETGKNVRKHARSPPSEHALGSRLSGRNWPVPNCVAPSTPKTFTQCRMQEKPR